MTDSLRFADAAAAERVIDKRPSAATLPAESVVESLAQEALDEDDYFPEIFEANEPLVEARSRVSWAPNDRASPCYSHLLLDAADTVAAPKTFEFGSAELELLIAANRYLPRGHYDVLAFGLRGARLQNADKLERVDRLPLEDVRPDHVKFRCVIGFYFRAQKKFSAYTASTVPWHVYMSKGMSLNLLPTGCYIYKKGGHLPVTKARWVIPALRLSDADLSDSGPATVLRTNRDLTYDINDEWDECSPNDNIHCAYSDGGFSSRGCQTVKGGMHDGLWADFQATIKTLPAGARVDYVLITGAECAIASSLVASGGHADSGQVFTKLTRLRTGSEGEEVSRLQAKLQQPVTGYFGARTKKLLTEAQKRNQLPADGIYAPATDAKLGWGVFSGEPMAMAAASGAPRVEAAPVAAAAAATTPATAITETLLRQMAPRPKSAKAAQFWDAYAGAITSADGAKVLAEYGLSKTPKRMAYILANMFSETDGLTLIWENMNYTAKGMVKTFGRAANLGPAEAARLVGKPHEIAERVYGLGNPRKAKILGNTQPGDGFRFRGGGFLQTTGRYNYRTLGLRIGEDLDGNPSLIENPLISLKAACAEWHRAGLNDYADRGEFRACCNGINLGDAKRKGTPLGYDKRLAYLKKTLKAYGLPTGASGGPEAMGASGALQLGDIGPEVEALQRDLEALGYDVGEIDGVFTTRTRDAVLIFQAHNDLPTTGAADLATREALKSPDASGSPEPHADETAIPEAASMPEEPHDGAWRRFLVAATVLIALGLLVAALRLKFAA